MVLDERSRHQLYLRLEEALGPDAATTLMEHLPPVGWADVATKRDLDAFEGRLDHRFEAIDHRFEAIDHRFEAIDRRFEALEERIDLRSEALENKLLATFRGELQNALTTQSRHLTIALVGTAATVSALAFTAAGLT